MSRSPTRAAGPYRVHFTSDAWKKIGQLSTASFQVIQAALEEIASGMGTARPVGDDADTPLSLPRGCSSPTSATTRAGH
jgi:hypothetical protein